MGQAILELVLSNVADVIVGVIAIISGYIILPFIQVELIPWLKEKRLYELVRKGVEAAEKLAEAGTIQKIEKKAYVVKWLMDYGVDIDANINTIIEAAVKELDNIENAVYEQIKKDDETAEVEKPTI